MFEDISILFFLDRIGFLVVSWDIVLNFYYFGWFFVDFFSLLMFF